MKIRAHFMTNSSNELQLCMYFPFLCSKVLKSREEIKEILYKREQAVLVTYLIWFMPHCLSTCLNNFITFINYLKFRFILIPFIIKPRMICLGWPSSQSLVDVIEYFKLLYSFLPLTMFREAYFILPMLKGFPDLLIHSYI